MQWKGLEQINRHLHMHIYNTHRNIGSLRNEYNKIKVEQSRPLTYKNFSTSKITDLDLVGKRINLYPAYNITF